MKNLKEVFVKLTVSCNWEEAQTKYPSHAQEERLSNFLQLPFKGGIPSIFREYCANAVLCGDSTQAMSISVTTDSTTATILKADYHQITGQEMQKVTKAGFKLIFAALPKVSANCIILYSFFQICSVFE